MQFPFHIDILDLMFKGVLIGILASAPMGPAGVLCIQRTLNKGRWYGFVTGIGAAVSDIFYALITGLGMSFVMEFIEKGSNLFYLQISGSITKIIHVSGNKKGSLVHNGVTAFLVTFSNPLIIFLFMGCYAQLAFVVPNHPLEMCVGYLSIVLGALLWWYGLTWLIDKIRGNFTTNGILIINRVIGSAVIIFSLLILFGTLFNIYHLH